MKHIINCQTGEVTIRELTDAEKEQEIIDDADTKYNLAKQDAKVQADADAKAALLDRLGITADEAKLLLS
jgi:hypothetical protein